MFTYRSINRAGNVTLGRETETKLDHDAPLELK